MSNTQEVEVIVTGAGPSGAYTAAALAQRGHEVLLIDRQAFPRDKICGDAVSKDVIDMLYDIGMEDKVLSAVGRKEFYPLNSLRVVSPGDHVVTAQMQVGANGTRSYVAPRVYFDAIIQQHAIDSGAQFLVADVKEPAMSNGTVTGVVAQVNGTQETIRSRVVVGADGVTSTIMRHLRPESNQHVDGHRAVALRAYIQGLELLPHEVEFFLYDKILPGYAWVFPAGDDLANIGLGMRLDHFRKLKRNLKKMLQEFLEMPAIKERLRPGWSMRDVAIWQLNFGSQRNLQHVFDGALLVGDAAGFINPLTGGGIYSGLESAVIATDVIDAALKRGATGRADLMVYEKRIHREMWSTMRKAYFYQRLLEYFPSGVDFLIHRAQNHSGLAAMFVNKL